MDDKRCEICKYCRQCKKFIPFDRNWEWFKICTYFMNEPDGWGIVVHERDRCECFDEKVSE